jgi:hypothetical protein
MPTKEIEAGDYADRKSKRKGSWRAKKRAKQQVVEEVPFEDMEMEETPEPPKKAKRSDKVKSALKKKAKTELMQAAEVGESSSGQGELLSNSFDSVLERIPSSMNQEMEQVREYRQMFETLSRMARIAEQKYLKDKQSRDMYAALKAYAEMREIIADMRALADFTEHANRINETVVTPLVQSSAAALVEYNKAVLGVIQKEIDSTQFPLIKKLVDSYARDAGTKLQSAQNTARESAAALFVVN